MQFDNLTKRLIAINYLLLTHLLLSGMMHTLADIRACMAAGRCFVMPSDASNAWLSFPLRWEPVVLGWGWSCAGVKMDYFRHTTMKSSARFFFFLFSGGLLFSCSPQVYFQRKLQQLEGVSQSHIGLLVYDPVKKNNLVAFNEKKHFTPASNIKLLTLYGSLQILGDSIPALRYAKKQDSLIIWGTGDPSFLYYELLPNDRIFTFLKDTPLELYFSASNFDTSPFGSGWAWEDYRYRFSAERSPFPLYGNCVTFAEDDQNGLRVSPSYFRSAVVVSEDSTAEKGVIREEKSNRFVFHHNASPLLDTVIVPFRTTPRLTTQLLKDTLQRAVILVHRPLPPQAETLYNIPADSLYRLMMRESDNFVAEQLLLVCAGLVSDTLSTAIAIDYIREKYLHDLLDDIRWVDGSGLSRYNLLTPRVIVQLWDKIDALIPRKRLFQLLAVGGQSGTLKKLHRSEQPYLYGKSGTLSNNYCLSGYIVTKKGKTLLFSFMNNHYTTPLQATHSTVERLLKEVYEKF